MDIPESKALVCMGREKILMSDFLQELENNLGIIEITCQKLNLARQTYYNWRDKDEWFREVSQEIMRKGEERLKDFAKHSLVSLILKQNVAAVIFYLKTRHPEYKETRNPIGDESELINYGLYIQESLNALNEAKNDKFEWQSDGKE